MTDFLEQDLAKIVDKVPGEESQWWKQDGRNTYLKVAMQLFYKGFSYEEIEELLNDLYWSAAEQYGG